MTWTELSSIDRAGWGTKISCIDFDLANTDLRFCLQVSRNPVMTQVTLQGADSPAPGEVAGGGNSSADETEPPPAAPGAPELGGIELAHHNYCELPEIKEEEDHEHGALLIDHQEQHPPPPPPPAHPPQPEEHQVRFSGSTFSPHSHTT